MKPNKKPHRGGEQSDRGRHYGSIGFGFFVKNSTWPQSAQAKVCNIKIRALGPDLNRSLPQNGHTNNFVCVP